MVMNTHSLTTDCGGKLGHQTADPLVSEPIQTETGASSGEWLAVQRTLAVKYTRDLKQPINRKREHFKITFSPTEPELGFTYRFTRIRSYYCGHGDTPVLIRRVIPFCKQEVTPQWPL